MLAVARSFVRCGDLDTALALAADVSPGADRATAVRISFSSGPIERRPDERIRCEVVEELAARGRFDEAAGSPRPSRSARCAPRPSPPWASRSPATATPSRPRPCSPR